jgi:hypothetical protein
MINATLGELDMKKIIALSTLSQLSDYKAETKSLNLRYLLHHGEPN